MNREVISKSRACVIWAIANLFYLYEVILRVSPSVMTNELMNHYGITTSMLGILISFFYYCYTAFQIPCGLILDRLGPRNLICISILSSIFGSALFVYTDQVWIGQIGRGLVGAGGACAFISCLKIASAVFPFKHFAIFAGITNMAGTFGAMCGGFPIAKSVNTLGWRETILILAAIGVVLLVAAFCIIPKRMKAFDGGSTHSFKSIFMKVVKNRQIILSGLVGGFMYLPISVFSELWAIPFFMTKYNINNETASIGSSILFVGFAIGSIAMAIIAKKINGYVKTIRFSSICVALLFIPLIYVDNIYLSFFTVFLIGIFTGAQVMIFTCAKNNESEKNSGTTVAFANFLVMLAGSIFQPVLGVLLDIFWTGKFSHDGTRLYEIVSYQKAIITLPICLVAAYILSIFIKETIHKEEKVLNNF